VARHRLEAGRCYHHWISSDNPNTSRLVVYQGVRRRSLAFSFVLLCVGLAFVAFRGVALGLTLVVISVSSGLFYL